MPRFKDDDFSKRRNTADKAKNAMLERFRARPSSDDPATAKRNAARLALSEARDSRVKAREEAVKKREEDEAQSARDKVEREAAESRAEADRKVNLLAVQKAARDARYAARKARGR
jgi:membrane protein involved in colicin uptake